MTRRRRAAAASAPRPAPVNALADAASAANKLGHLALHQRRAFECARCGASGIVGPDGKQLGAVFTARCEP